MEDEAECYLPASDFLMLVLDKEVPLSGSALGDANLVHLIAMTCDPDRSNRDWAVFLLMQTGFDSPEIRAAFVRALDDEDDDVRAEALVGIAQRDRVFARPLVQALLEADWVSGLTLEAASFVADPALLPSLRALEASNADETDPSALSEIVEAVTCCRTGEQPDWGPGDD